MSLFPDVPDNSPFADAIDFMVTFGIMVGDEYGNFNPRSPISKAEVCIILSNLFSLDIEKSSNDSILPKWVGPDYDACRRAGLLFCVNWEGNLSSDATQDDVRCILSDATYLFKPIIVHFSFTKTIKVSYRHFSKEICAHIIYSFCKCAANVVYQELFKLDSNHDSTLQAKALELLQKYEWLGNFFSPDQSQVYSALSPKLSVPMLTQLQTLLKIRNHLDQFRCKDSFPVYHYTSLKVLEILSQPDATFHLSNTAYLNDPQEGLLGLKLLREELEAIHGKTLPSYWTPFLSSSAGIFIHQSFVASFIKKCDTLPMWVQYGANGKGCCLEINTAEVCDPLYSIIYLKDDLIKFFKSIFRELEEYKQKYSAVDPATDSIFLYARNILIHVCYLYKDSAYQHENEIRILTFAPLKKAKTELSAREGEDFPRVFLETDLFKNCDHTKGLPFSSIMLGPAVLYPERVATALVQRGYDPAIIKKSAISFRP